MLSIEIIPCLNDNYSYLLYDKESNIVAIVDPSDFHTCDKIINKKYNKLDYILNTHHHFDHVGGNKKLKEKYKSKVLGFELDKDRLPGIDIVLKENKTYDEFIQKLSKVSGLSEVVAVAAKNDVDY